MIIDQAGIPRDANAEHQADVFVGPEINMEIPDEVAKDLLPRMVEEAKKQWAAGMETNAEALNRMLKRN